MLRSANMKQIDNMRLKDVVIQLRKVRSHPVLFKESRVHQYVMEEQHVNASWKVMVHEQLLTALLAHTHNVLLFLWYVTARHH